MDWTSRSVSSLLLSSSDRTLAGSVCVDEQFDVGAQARQRCPQLVPGVLDQPSLRRPGTGERGEHRVERLGQPGDLALAAHRDLRGQILRAGHALGPGREHVHRPQRRAGHHQADQRGHRDADEPDQTVPQAQFGQCVLDSLGVPGHLRGAVGALHRPHAIPVVADLDDLGFVGDLARRDLTRVRTHRDGRRLPGGARGVPGPVQELDGDPGGAVGPGLRASPIGRGQRRQRVGRRLGLGRELCVRVQLSVELLVELGPHQQPRRERDAHYGDGDRCRGHHREPGPQRHLPPPSSPQPPLHSGFSRRTYPTPRTVCRSRGSPPASSLRRR